MLFRSKVGRSERAAQSTLTHTGALAGSSRVFDALCERHGVAICDSLDDLVETGRLLAVSPRPRGQRAACLVFSGSLRSYLLDHVEENGMTLAEPAPATMEAIAGMAPLDLRIPNPLDCGSLFTQQARYLEIARRLLDDSGVDLLLVEEHAPDPLRNRDPALFKALAGATDKPVVILPETGFSLTPYAREFLASAAIPYAQGVDRGLAAAGNLVRHAAAVRARRLRERIARNPRAFAPGLHGMAQLGDALQDWGIPVSPQGFAEDLSQAEALAGSLGYPLVMKVDSPDIAHKSDAGGVMLGLADEAALRRAWHDIHANVARKAPGARIAGMQLARMAAPGLEMNMGVHRDPQFGLVIMVSLGGIWVEALGDLSLRMLPIDARDAHEMLAELKGAALLGRFRGSAPRDEPALVRADRKSTRLNSSH